MASITGTDVVTYSHERPGIVHLYLRRTLSTTAIPPMLGSTLCR